MLLCTVMGTEDKGPDTLISSGLKHKEKEQSLSWELLGGAGSVPKLSSAPCMRSSWLCCLFMWGINHLGLDKLELQLLLHVTHQK